MSNSWRLGRFAGIDVNIHWSFLLAPALVFLSNLHHYPLLAVTTVLAVFGCVVLHEFGHALMARRFGIGTRDITLYPMGGVARLERMPEQPGREIAIALAGPAVNVAIAGGLWAGLAMGGPLALNGFMPMLLVNLLIANIGLVIFNLIPAFPMDGGRVFRAVLAYFVSRPRATEVAARLGMLVAGLFLVAGLWNGMYSLALVGMFVLFAGKQELSMVRMQEQQRRRTLNDNIVTVEPAPYGHGPVAGFQWDPNRRVWVTYRHGPTVDTHRGDDAAAW